MRKKSLTILIASVLCASMILTGCSTKKKDEKSIAPVNIDGPYTVTATIQPSDGVYYFVGIQHIDNDTDVGMISSVDSTGTETNINITAKAGCTKCDIYDSSGAHSLYCEGNLLSEGVFNILQGNVIYSTFKNLLATVIFEEDMAGADGPYKHAISNLENKAYDVNYSTDGNGVVTSVTSEYTYEDYQFDISYAPNPEIPQLDISNSSKIAKGDLINTVNTLADYMFSSVVGATSANKPSVTSPEPEPTQAPEPVEQEPTTRIMSKEIVNLPEAKDLFIKINFSNRVDDVEFVGPTGGSYKVSSGNVEYMLDDYVSKTAFYRIPNAEMGMWTLKYDNAVNEVEVEVVYDNIIKISSMALSDIKDGIITVTPNFMMPKGLDVSYEYHIDIIKDNKTIEHTSNILNTKTDKAIYKASVMNLEPGIYKIRLRLEYEYDGKHYINIFTSEEFAKE